MTYAEIETQIKRLTRAEQILLLETIAHWLREATLQAEAQGHERSEERRKRLESIPPASALRGIAKMAGQVPTDDELKEDYIKYLERKYA